MFDSKQTLTNRLADAVDLAIDFATLGEYGLEPVGRTPEPCEADARLRGAAQATAATDRRTHLNQIYALSCRNRPGRDTKSSGPGRRLSRQRGARGASSAVPTGSAA